MPVSISNYRGHMYRSVNSNDDGSEDDEDEDDMMRSRPGVHANRRQTTLHSSTNDGHRDSRSGSHSDSHNDSHNVR